MKKIDENLYSRQIFTYGKETMEEIVKKKILIMGLRGRKILFYLVQMKFQFQTKISVE